MDVIQLRGNAYVRMRAFPHSLVHGPISSSIQFPSGEGHRVQFVREAVFIRDDREAVFVTYDSEAVDELF
jgi:hypothetical protein